MTQNETQVHITRYGASLFNIVLVVALAAGILFPAIFYGVLLRPRTASDVLIAISICLFASIVYLWTLHAISIITFRDPWMGKAIFGAAITGILATSVAIYRTQLSNTYPFDGKWDVILERTVGDNSVCVWRGKILVANNSWTDTYSGMAEDASAFTDGCPYGIKAISRIEWDDKRSFIDLSFVNFPPSQTHDPLNAAPPSIILPLIAQGTEWVSVKPKSDDKGTSAPFHIDLKRSL